MIHRAEQVVQAAMTALTGLVTTGTNVFRGRSEAHDLQEPELPALLVFEGDDDKLTDLLNDRQQWAQDINIDVVVAETLTSTAGTTINQIRAEITAALAADFTLGLAFVEAIQEIGAGTPDFAGSDREVAGRRIVWRVEYERSRTDPTS